jgi:hypothetical protein
MSKVRESIGITELSRRLGRSDRQLRRLAADGKIPRNRDGSFDEAAVRKSLDKRTGPHRARPLKEQVDVRTPPPVANLADARAAVSLIQQILREEGRPVSGPPSFDDLRSAESILKTRERALRLSIKRGELVDKRQAMEVTFNLARQLRDGVQNWPAQVAAVMAGELQVDAFAMETALTKSIADLLNSLADVDVNRVMAGLSAKSG